MDDSILLAPGFVLGGQYEIEGVLGKPGGFGITYRALDTRLGVHVAVKEFFPRTHARRATDGRSIRPNTLDDAPGLESGKRRFLEEARLLARYRHPNIVRVRTYFEENDTAYLVMDYLDGAPLSLYLERKGGRIDAASALSIVRPVLLALRELHGGGIVHRDVDPHNIYLTRSGDVVLLDFGAARVAEAADRGASMSVVLKPGYAPYEQYASHGRLGPWTDLYAVGATLYRMLTGTVPPEATARILDDELVPLAEAAPEAPASLARAVTWALSLRPEQRPQSVDAFEAVLNADEPPASWPSTPSLAHGGGYGGVAAHGGSAVALASTPSPRPVLVPAQAEVAVADVAWEDDADLRQELEPRSHAGRWALVVVLFALGGLALVGAWRSGMFGRMGLGGPRAADDSFVITEGQMLEADVLSNDIDPAGEGLRVIDMSTPAGGLLRSTGGVLRYTPRAGFFGEDRFSYTLSDAQGRTDSARVVVIVERSAARLRHDELAGSLYASVRERLDASGLWLVEGLVDGSGAPWETGSTSGECVDGESAAEGSALVLRLTTSRCEQEQEVELGDSLGGSDDAEEGDGGFSSAASVGTAAARLGLRVERGLVQADVFREGRDDGSLTLTLASERADLALTLDRSGYRLMRLARPDGSGADEIRRGDLSWNGSRLHVTFLVDNGTVSLFLGNNAVARIRGVGAISNVHVEGLGSSVLYRVDGLGAYALDDRARLLALSSL